MKKINLTHPGGLPFEQHKFLDFMQGAYYEVLEALLSHFVLNPTNKYIISGCEVVGATIDKGWMIIDNELVYFDGGNGNTTTKIKIQSEVTPLTFQDGNIHDIYTFKQAVISTSGTALNSFIRIPNVNEFLTSVPNATETLRGIAEIATQTEVNSNTEDTRFITAKKLYNRFATESRRGVAEIATQTETNAGVDDTRMVTPKKVVQAINDLAPQPPQATESVKGIAEIATQTEANGSTDDQRIITPKKLYNRTASTSRRGVAEIATQTEVNIGVDNTRIVTPKTLRNAGFAKTKIFGYVYLGNLPSTNPIASGDITSATALNASGGSPDSRLRLYFPSVGTSQYTPIVYIESLHADYNIDNDTIVSIKNIQSSYFEVLLREVSTPHQNVRLRVQIII